MARSDEHHHAATLHDHAPNTYYGQWPGEKALFPGLELPAIALNERAASAKFGAFDVPERDFSGNCSPPRWKFVYRPKKKFRPATAPFADRDGDDAAPGADGEAFRRAAQHDVAAQHALGGGLRAVGLSMTRYTAFSGTNSLLLISRTGMPPPKREAR